MKRICMLIVCLWMTSAYAVTNTNVVAFTLLNVAPEDYKNKQVVYSAVYHGFQTSFPPYMENSGFKEGKWMLLEIGSARLPVMMKKNDANNALLATLRQGSQVKVAGRVRAFHVDARRGGMPEYYVDADDVTLENGPDPMGFMRGPEPQRERARERMRRPNR